MREIAATERDRPSPRVLHVCTRYLRGSSEQRLLDLMQAIPEAEHHLVVGGDSWPGLSEASVPAARITVEPRLVRRVSAIDDARAAWRLARLMRRLRPDLVVTHQSKSGFVGRTAALFAGRPPAMHVLSMASFGPGYSRRASRVFRAAERALAPVTTRYATVGADLAARYIEMGIPPEKVRVIRSGVTIGGRIPRAEARDRLIRRFGLPADRPFVVSLASLEDRNGSWELPQLASRWAALTPRPFLVVSGSGPLEEALRRELGEAGLAEHSALVGQLADARVLISAASAVVLLSRDGGLPEALVQAAASGVPFVSYDIDGAQELLAMGASGAVVPAGDVAGAAAAVVEIVTVGQAGAPIDPTPWSTAEVVSGFRAVVEDVLASAR